MSSDLPKVVSVRVADIRPGYSDLLDWCSDPDNEYIGRAGIVFVERDGKKFRYPQRNSLFANPFKLPKDASEADVTECLEKFRQHLISIVESSEDVKSELLLLREKKRLGCWCKTKKTPNARCHGDVVLELLEKYSR